MKEKQLIKTIVEGIQEKKGKKITTVDLSNIESAAASYFVICEGQSTTPVAAIADSINIIPHQARFVNIQLWRKSTNIFVEKNTS